MEATLDKPAGPQRYATYDEDDFIVFPSVPVWKEHTNERDFAKPVHFGEEELREVVERCNRRIADTGDYPPVVLRHTSDEDKSFDPPVVGFAGPFRMGTIGEEDPKPAILADLRVFKEDVERVRRYPRLSVEYWASDDNPTGGYFDPISLLGAETPELDLGIRFSKSGLKAARYSRLAMPIRYEYTLYRGPQGGLGSKHTGSGKVVYDGGLLAGRQPDGKPGPINVDASEQEIVALRSRGEAAKAALGGIDEQNATRETLAELSQGNADEGSHDDLESAAGSLDSGQQSDVTSERFPETDFRTRESARQFIGAISKMLHKERNHLGKQFAATDDPAEKTRIKAEIESLNADIDDLNKRGPDALANRPTKKDRESREFLAELEREGFDAGNSDQMAKVARRWQESDANEQKNILKALAASGAFALPGGAIPAAAIAGTMKMQKLTSRRKPAKYATWRPYRGKQGGVGSQNTQTGEVVYDGGELARKSGQGDHGGGKEARKAKDRADKDKADRLGALATILSANGLLPDVLGLGAKAEKLDYEIWKRAQADQTDEGQKKDFLRQLASDSVGGKTHIGRDMGDKARADDFETQSKIEEFMGNAAASDQFQGMAERLDHDVHQRSVADESKAKDFLRSLAIMASGKSDETGIAQERRDARIESGGGEVMPEDQPNPLGSDDSAAAREGRRKAKESRAKDFLSRLAQSRHSKRASPARYSTAPQGANTTIPAEISVKKGDYEMLSDSDKAELRQFVESIVEGVLAEKNPSGQYNKDEEVVPKDGEGDELTPYAKAKKYMDDGDHEGLVKYMHEMDDETRAEFMAELEGDDESEEEQHSYQEEEEETADYQADDDDKEKVQMSKRYAKLEGESRKLKRENRELRVRCQRSESRIERLERDKTKAVRYAALKELQEDGFAFDLDVELDDVLDLNDEQFDKHTDRIKACYQRVPLDSLPTTGPRRYVPQDKSDEKAAKYSKEAIALVEKRRAEGKKIDFAAALEEVKANDKAAA